MTGKNIIFEFDCSVIKVLHMEKQICQSCGMQLGDPGLYGTNADDSRNNDYCNYCFAMGGFTEEISMEEMIERNLEYLDQYNMNGVAQYDAEQERAKMTEYFPSLKRWQK